MRIPFDTCPIARVALLSACLCAPAAGAQVAHGGWPESLTRALPAPAAQVAVPPPDLAPYLAEDEARAHRPLRYGALVDLALTVEDGELAELEDGWRVFRLRVVSEGAKSLALEFASLWLPPGARLFVFGEQAETVLGAYVAENVHPDGGFVFEPLRGAELTLEIDLPPGAEPASFTTRALIYDYRDVHGLMDGTVVLGEGGEDGSFLGSCLIDVNCPEGDGWEDQKRATVRTFSGGIACSSALLSNSAGDGTPYVLTADHCGQTSNTVFRFRYERPGCGAGEAPTTMTVSGAELLTTNAALDSRLLRITSAVPLEYEPYYAGWSRSTANVSHALSMGHPWGGPKNIALSESGASPVGNLWRVQWTKGRLDGGNSGGPLFDQDGRVRGPACCVTNFTCGEQVAGFGRFDLFWTSNGLAPWLDPLGLDPLSIPGFDPGPPCAHDVQSYCATSPNSAGPGALIAGSGSTSVAANDFHLSAFGLPAAQSALFYYGEHAAQVPFGDGFRCVGAGSAGILRLSVVQADPFGDLFQQLDFTQPPASAGPGRIDPGSLWRFQCWYRDPAAGAFGFNLSDGLAVAFCP